MQERERNFDTTKPEQISTIPQSPYATSKTDDHVPAWIKIFGGTVVSVIFLLVITMVGYFINHMNNMQTSIVNLTGEMVSKREFNERQTAIWNNLKERNAAIDGMKERLTAVEKEQAAYKERISVQEQQLKQLQEENRQLGKDLQALRERVAALEGKKPQ